MDLKPTAAEIAAFEEAFEGFHAMVGDGTATAKAGKRVVKPSNMFRVWLKLTREPVRVLVDLHGGAIHAVAANRPAEVLFISNQGDDVAEFMSSDYPALVPTSEDMDDPHAWWRHAAEVKADEVDHYFDQLKGM